jgi:hypothetical protein
MPYRSQHGKPIPADKPVKPKKDKQSFESDWPVMIGIGFFAVAIVGAVIALVILF